MSPDKLGNAIGALASATRPGRSLHPIAVGMAQNTSELTDCERVL